MAVAARRCSRRDEPDGGTCAIPCVETIPPILAALECGVAWSAPRPVSSAIMVAVLIGSGAKLVGDRGPLRPCPSGSGEFENAHRTQADGFSFRTVFDRRDDGLAQPARRTDAQKKPDYRTEFTYVTMSDGVKIALAVAYPRGFAADPATAPPSSAAVRTWPAVLEMHGYPDSTFPQSPEVFGHQYVTVRASLRGAGALDGVIQPISQRNGQDGYEVIENWIVKQPWSNGKVAIHGHSWGGLSALMVAATNPPHLKAVAVSGLMDDIYRDIGRIGGVRNAGFPMEWMVNLYNPLGPFDSGEAAPPAARALDRGIPADRGIAPTLGLFAECALGGTHQPAGPAGIYRRIAGQLCRRRARSDPHHAQLSR